MDEKARAIFMPQVSFLGGTECQQHPLSGSLAPLRDLTWILASSVARLWLRAGRWVDSEEH